METVDEELTKDRLIFGVCFWRMENGKKVRVPPWDVQIRDYGSLLGAEAMEKAAPIPIEPPNSASSDPKASE